MYQNVKRTCRVIFFCSLNLLFCSVVVAVVALYIPSDIPSTSHLFISLGNLGTNVQQAAKDWGQDDSKMAVVMEGPLSKWTNVVKGWQYRWFVLDDNTGLLSYYTVSTISTYKTFIFPTCFQQNCA